MIDRICAANGTMALTEIIFRDPTLRRDFWLKVADEIKVVMDNMKPLLKNWLKERVDGMGLGPPVSHAKIQVHPLTFLYAENDDAFQEIRDLYLPMPLDNSSAPQRHQYDPPSRGYAVP